ncbi:MAG: amidohydrolase family protein [Treponema sp.]|jgi:N-acyl-D-aspartate/D-glutamate deacylase|nr:amidohydrolase family protein [Treponema sp.]
MFDLLLKNAFVMDGSGKPGFPGDIGVRDGLIEAVAPRLEGSAVRTVDLQGRIAAPGFLDIHRHADAAVFRPGFGEAELRQGITTIVNGNCGMSIAPLPAARRDEMLRFLAPVTGSLPEEIRFETFSEYRALLESRPLPLNFAMLAGSGAMRAAAAGYGRPGAEAVPGIPDSDTLKKIRGYLEDALSAGALGASAGLSYLPDIYYSAAGLAAALAPLGGAGLPLVCHVRGEGDLLYGSVGEAIETARLLGVPLRISHFKCIGRRNWGSLLEKTIALIERNRNGGMKIDCDFYPWTAGSTQMMCVLPPAFLEGGTAETVRRLRDPKERAACRDMLLKEGDDFENIVAGVGWDRIFVSGVGSEKNSALTGKNIAGIAADRGIDPFDAAFDLLVEENCNVTMVDYIACQEDIDRIASLPYASIISDSLYSEGGLPHPRTRTNTSMVFYDLVRRGVLSAGEAVHKLTGLPAEAMGIRRKGFLKTGCDADITVFSPENISPPAAYTKPETLAAGFDYVFIAGQAVVEKDALTGAAPGRCVGRE